MTLLLFVKIHSEIFLANPVNHDTRDAVLCQVQYQVHLHLIESRFTPGAPTQAGAPESRYDFTSFPCRRDKLCTVQCHSGNRRFGKRAAIGAADQRTDFGLGNVSRRRDRAGSRAVGNVITVHL